jgi:RNA polymerase sigma-70 factor (ECF subfamily)
MLRPGPASENQGQDRITIAAEETAIAEAARVGDPRAFDLIMRRYNQRLYRLAVSIIGERDEAHDVLQDSYVRAFGRFTEYSGKGGLGSWLASIVRNEAIDRLRSRNSRARHITIEAEFDVDKEHGQAMQMKSFADEHLSPETVLEQEQVRHLLESTVALLPAAFRTVFILRQVEGLSLEETATYLEIPVATVKTRDHRARALLRGYLGEKLDAVIPRTFTFGGANCDQVVARVLERLRH